MKWNERLKQWDDVRIEDMIGRHFETISVVDDPDVPNEIYFEDKDGRFTFYHDQDCCESVNIESIVGDMLDLIRGPILVAEEVVNTRPSGGCEESCTWTFYKFATFNGYVDIRWVGESNGYYSESVDLKYESKVNPE